MNLMKQKNKIVCEGKYKIDEKNTRRYFDTTFSNEMHKAHKNKNKQLNSSELKNYKSCMNRKDNKFSNKEYSNYTKYDPHLEKEKKLNKIINDEKNDIIENRYKEEEKDESFIYENDKIVYNDKLLLKERNLNDTYDFKNSNKKNAQNSNNSIKSYIDMLKKDNFNTILSIIDNDIKKKKEIYYKKMTEYNNFIYTVDRMYLQNWENEHELADDEIELYLIQNKNMENEGKELLVFVENMINELRNILKKIKRGVYVNKDEFLNIQKELNTVTTLVKKIEEENYHSISQQGEYKYFLKKIGFKKKCRNTEFQEFYEKKFSKEKGGKNPYTLYWNKFKNSTDTKAKNVLKSFSKLLRKI